MSGGIGLTVADGDLWRTEMTGQGFLSMSEPRGAVQAAVTAVTQELRVSAIPLAAGMVVTNIHWNASVAGTSVTAGWGVLYAKDGTRLGISADDATLFTAAAAFRTAALASTYTVPTTDLYYAGYLVVFTGTAPQISRTASVSNLFDPVGSGKRGAAVMASQTSPPASATFTASGTRIWVGAS